MRIFTAKADATGERSPEQSHERRSLGEPRRFDATSRYREEHPSGAPPIVYDVLNSPGQPLEPGARGTLEAHFGHDFGGVRVHSDELAAKSVDAVSARAYTVGSNVVFGSGYYTPTSRDGLGLLAHELTHVVQQAGAIPNGPLSIQDSGHPSEKAAQVAAGRFAAGAPPVSMPSFHFNTLQRDTGATDAAATESPVAAEKTSELLEESYRKSGQAHRAEAIRLCRVEGGNFCLLVLTEKEARAAYDLVEAGYGAQEAATSVTSQSSQGAALAPAIGTLAAPAALEQGAAALGSTSAEEIAGVVIKRLPAVALGALFLATLAEEVRFSHFVDLLEAAGFAVLLNPLGACIGGCHSSATERSLRDLPRLDEPLQLSDLRPRVSEAMQGLLLAEWLAKESQQSRPSEPRTDPVSPPLPHEEEEPRRRGCTVEEVAPKFGRKPCHSDFAKTFSGTRREFRVTDPKGIAIDFDAKRGSVLYEVKTGYEWLLNERLSPKMQERKKRVIDDFQEQAGWQMFVASRCGFELDWYFNTQKVAKYCQSFVEPDVKWKNFDCDQDSDHTW